MKKVTLIGDCHSARVLEHYNPKVSPVEFNAWGKGGMMAWNFVPEEKSKDNAESVGTEYDSLYFNPPNNGIIKFNDIVDQDLILPWLGYVDIRQALPGHKDADRVAKQYVERFVTFFNTSEVRFVEPLPQLIPLLMKFPGLHPEYTFEERLEQNNLFIKSLRKYSDEYGLRTPISQEQIFNALGLTQEEMTEDKTFQPGPHPFDKLKREYMGKVYNLLVTEAAK